MLIGTSNYPGGALQSIPQVKENLYALKEALCSAEIWGLPRENCTVVLDPKDITEMMDPIAEAATTRDTLLIYFSGHGLPAHHDGELLLSLTTTRPGRDYSSVAYGLIRNEVVHSHASRIIVILDCCYSGRALGRMGNPDPAPTLANDAEIEGTYLIAAAAESQRALAEPEETFTAFTAELLTVLKKGIPGGGPHLDIESIFGQLYTNLRAKGRPLPQRRIRNHVGKLAIVRNRAFNADNTQEEGHPGADDNTSDRKWAEHDRLPSAGSSRTGAGRAEAGQISRRPRIEAGVGLTRIDAVMPVPDGTDAPREYWLFSGERYLRVDVSSLDARLRGRMTGHSPLDDWAGTFKKLPEFQTKIDMILGVPDNHNEYWVFSGGRYVRISVAATKNGVDDKLQDGPKPLSDWVRTFGEFSDLDHIDTLMPVPETGGRNQYWVFAGTRYLRTWVNHGLDGQIEIHPTGFDGWSSGREYSFLKGWPGTFNRVSPFNNGIDAVIPLPAVKNGEEEHRDYWVFSENQYMKIRVIADLYSDMIIQFPATLGG
ncbi:caspase family protein [Actinomadura sp. NAK00032]|uniref:caspase family protein n=1 Tax=Actinomadura sp. NAK00032 TaxID=2742128 RepID=UPI00158F9FE9|nr:caspase family protein [Actinomadura sp. NAK00032]QKW33334.1 caspase family protein [Actinomadura sp. NAK00032]